MKYLQIKVSYAGSRRTNVRSREWREPREHGGPETPVDEMERQAGPDGLASQPSVHGVGRANIAGSSNELSTSQAPPP